MSVVIKPAIHTLPESIQNIIQRLETSVPAKPAEVRKIVLAADVQPSDLLPWADFDHPVTDSYGRKLVYEGRNYEIMVMSWKPGDFSTIHDHGSTQWGAVQVFGPAEHATFRIMDGEIQTLARWTFSPYDVVGVSHSLLHQMGNPTTDKFFLTLHVYGIEGEVENVTGDAQVIDLENNTIQRVDGGVFFGLQSKDIKRVEEGPEGDFPTRLRHMVELVRRLKKMDARGLTCDNKDLGRAQSELFSADQKEEFFAFLDELVDVHGHQTNSMQWRILNWELREMARLQLQIRNETKSADSFDKYAEVYDELIGKPCLDAFMSDYLEFFLKTCDVDLADHSLISLGCGTGLIEQYLIDINGASYDSIYGIDISEAMVLEAKKRIQADVGDILTLDPSVRIWDIAFSGLNVYHYLDHNRLEEAVRKTAAIIRPGGYFIGDFITPDHIRWYPNVMYSSDRNIVSLRTARLTEEGGRMFKSSQIVNVRFADGRMHVHDAGTHRRFLPPMHRIRTYFEKAFDGGVRLYDAHSLELIPEWADSCRSTRYVVIAHKA